MNVYHIYIGGSRWGGRQVGRARKILAGGGHRQIAGFAALWEMVRERGSRQGQRSPARRFLMQRAPRLAAGGRPIATYRVVLKSASSAASLTFARSVKRHIGQRSPLRPRRSANRSRAGGSSGSQHHRKLAVEARFGSRRSSRHTRRDHCDGGGASGALKRGRSAHSMLVRRPLDVCSLSGPRASARGEHTSRRQRRHLAEKA